ncbi:hypothetical protein SDB85_16100, partial [Legionella pneumophila serogroup 8]|nr:hypothetical protein [Legionella pneumophila]MDW9150486.1 hypothetical protein [Legionella pneumophila]MDX1857149.1 hypothetical protein [Legionella pneumophila]
RFLAEKIWIINESVSYFNEFRPLDCFVATLLATTVPKIVPYRGNTYRIIDSNIIANIIHEEIKGIADYKFTQT